MHCNVDDHVMLLGLKLLVIGLRSTFQRFGKSFHSYFLSSSIIFCTKLFTNSEENSAQKGRKMDKFSAAKIISKVFYLYHGCSC